MSANKPNHSIGFRMSKVVTMGNGGAFFHTYQFHGMSPIEQISLQFEGIFLGRNNPVVFGNDMHDGDLITNKQTVIFEYGSPVCMRSLCRKPIDLHETIPVSC